MFPAMLELLAAALATTAYVPQVVHTWRSKFTQSLSLPMLMLFARAHYLWLVYGLWIHEVPVVVANGSTLLLALSLFGLKLTYCG